MFSAKEPAPQHALTPPSPEIYLPGNAREIGLAGCVCFEPDYDDLFALVLTHAMAEIHVVAIAAELNAANQGFAIGLEHLFGYAIFLQRAFVCSASDGIKQQHRLNIAELTQVVRLLLVQPLICIAKGFAFSRLELRRKRQNSSAINVGHQIR